MQDTDRRLRFDLIESCMANPPPRPVQGMLLSLISTLVHLRESPEQHSQKGSVQAIEGTWARTDVLCTRKCQGPN